MKTSRLQELEEDVRSARERTLELVEEHYQMLFPTEKPDPTRTTVHKLKCGHTLVTYKSNTSATLDRHRKTCRGAL